MSISLYHFTLYVRRQRKRKCVHICFKSNSPLFGIDVILQAAATEISFFYLQQKNVFLLWRAQVIEQWKSDLLTRVYIFRSLFYGFKS